MAWATDVDGAQLAVGMGFGYAPNTPIASIVWTDVTTDVRNLGFEYGKSDSLDTYQAGRLSMTLDDRGRKYDPLYSAGPYFGNLKPMVPVRVLLTYGATGGGGTGTPLLDEGGAPLLDEGGVALYEEGSTGGGTGGTAGVLWLGFVSGFPQHYDPPRDATTNVTASDGFKVLQGTKLPALYPLEVAADSPVLWWRLGEQQGTVAIDSSGNNNNGAYEGGAVFGSATGLVADATDAAIGFTGPLTTTVGHLAWPSFPFSVELWFSHSATTNVYYLLRVQNVNDGDSSLAVSVNPLTNYPGGLQVEMGNGRDGFNRATRTSTSNTLNDGATHHMVAVFTNATSAPALYIDGVLDASTTFDTPSLPETDDGNVEIRLPPQGVNGLSFAGTLDEFAVYPTALNGTRIAAHYAAGTTPFAGLSTSAAVTKVLDEAGWPAADRLIEAGVSTVTTMDLAGQTALEGIQAIERAEQGRFFIEAGVATFYARHHPIVTAASTTAQATFGDSTGELKYGDLELEYSEDQIRNSVTTSRQSGNAYTVKDAASIAAYGEHEYSITGLYNSDNDEISDLGQWVLAHYKDPAVRVPLILIQPRRDPTTLFAQIRDRQLLDRVTVKRRPQGVGSAISLDVLIEGIRHEVTVSPLDWKTSVLLSPAEAQIYAVLNDTTYGVLGTAALAF